MAVSEARKRLRVVIGYAGAILITPIYLPYFVVTSLLRAWRRKRYIKKFRREPNF